MARPVHPLVRQCANIHGDLLPERRFNLFCCDSFQAIQAIGRRDGPSIRDETLAFNSSAIQQQVVITQLHYNTSLALTAQGLTPELTGPETSNQASNLADENQASSAPVE